MTSSPCCSSWGELGCSIFLLLCVCPLALESSPRAIRCAALIAAGRSQAPNHTLAIALCLGSQTSCLLSHLGCFQLLWSKVAAMASKFRARVLELCACLPGVRGFALHAVVHSAPWLLVNGQRAAQTPFPWKSALPKMSNGKHFYT